MKRVRADILLVDRGLAPSRTRAAALIMAGKVISGAQRVEKPGTTLPRDAELTILADEHAYVSRGGVKLAGALDAFSYDPTGKTAADFGASTGGFSDCLLQRGVKKIYAIDVGYGQLADKIRNDSRVVVMERTNARNLQAENLPEPVDLVVIDASFIGVEKLLDAAKHILKPEGDVIALVKPQFQVGREKVGKGGIVRDHATQQEAVDEVVRFAQTLHFKLHAQCESPITGADGNREFFIWLGKS